MQTPACSNERPVDTLSSAEKHPRLLHGYANSWKAPQQIEFSATLCRQPPVANKLSSSAIKYGGWRFEYVLWVTGNVYYRASVCDNPNLSPSQHPTRWTPKQQERRWWWSPRGEGKEK